MSLNFKDHFSNQSIDYSKYRPGYPPSLFSFLAEISTARDLALDCATGNGQAAVMLAPYFHKVIAGDASEKQIACAQIKDNVLYKVFTAEKTNLADHSVDLVTVAQALHWFHFDSFYKEVNRVLKEDGVIAVWSYGLHSVEDSVDEIVKEFYHNTIGTYWPPERRYVEDHYQSIPFPFREISAPSFQMSEDWDLYEFLGYLRTWSAVQKYIEDKKTNPLDMLAEKIVRVWPDAGEKKIISWPLILKVGRK